MSKQNLNVAMRDNFSVRRLREYKLIRRRDSGLLPLFASSLLDCCIHAMVMGLVWLVTAAYSSAQSEMSVGPPVVRLGHPRTVSDPVVPYGAMDQNRYLSVEPTPRSNKTNSVPVETLPAPIRNDAFRVETPRKGGDVPSILNDTQPVEVSLGFLIYSSLASRKTFANFGGAVTVDRTTTAFDYDIARQLQQIALSTFDPSVSGTFNSNDINRPDNSFFGPGLQQQNEIDEIEFNTRVSKIWENGLISSFGYEPSLAYLFFPQGNGSGFNPTHSSDLVTRIEQPLLRGRGRDVNRVTIRIAETRARQSQFEIEAALQSQLRSIEQVYWKLHADFVRRQAIDDVISLSKKIVDVVQDRFELERVTYSDLARAKVQLEGLYQQRLETERAIQTASYDLAQLVGLELSDKIILVPKDEPIQQRPEFDADQVLGHAMASNLSLKRQKQLILIQQQTMVGAKNQLLPTLNFVAAHRTSGVEDDLGGALDQMFDYRFNDITLGMRFTQQLGMRQARSQVETTRLNTAKEIAILEALERSVGFDLLNSLNEVKQAYAKYESALRQVEQSRRWVDIAKIRYEDPPMTGSKQESLLVSLVDYQDALQSMIDSIVIVASSLSEYNNALALVEERSGNLLSKWNVAASSECETLSPPSVVEHQTLSSSDYVPANGQPVANPESFPQAPSERAAMEPNPLVVPSKQAMNATSASHVIPRTVESNSMLVRNEVQVANPQTATVAFQIPELPKTASTLPVLARPASRPMPEKQISKPAAFPTKNHSLWVPPLPGREERAPASSVVPNR